MPHWTASLLLLAGCASAPAPERTSNIELHNWTGMEMDLERIRRIQQAQYDFLCDYVGSEPGKVHVHVEKGLGCAYSTLKGPYPEMHLQDFGAYDPTNNVGHEMMHCFGFRYGCMPHWFNESIADMAWVDGEVAFLEDQNRLLLAVLSEAAGEDLTRIFVEEFGFNPRTRERQTGY